MTNEQNEQIFFCRAGSICEHMEETLGTDTFLKLTLEKVTVNPSLTIPSKVMFLNQEGKLKMDMNYDFQASTLCKDEWLDIFIDSFCAKRVDCKCLLGVLTSTQNINWYIDFVTNQLKLSNAIDRQGQRIAL